MPILAPHLDGLYGIPMNAWNEYHRAVPQDLQVRFCSRTRASAIHNLMVANAHAYAASTDGVRTFESQQMVGITIDGRLAIRFKKLDEDSLSRNQPTRQVEEYRNQQPLDGIDAAHFLELGYLTDETGTKLLEIRIAHPSGRGVSWWARLDGGVAVPVVVDLFQPPSGDGEVEPPRIAPKKSDNVVPLRKTDNEN